MPRFAFAVSLLLAGSASAAAPSFGREVRPILSDHCFTCHGPDEKQRKADLRLDEKTPAQAARKDILARITSADPHERMPPKAGRPLSPAQIDTLRRWVEAGAPWEEHWAFVAPTLPSVPAVAGHPIDAFIAAKLREHGLELSPPADKVTLIRRVTLGLTGLPPTPAEVDAFTRDDSPDAYEKVVERLLKSPRYGERMAWPWLEAARYADTSGYQSDGDRDMYRWRDWVIDAYNSNMPFDRFTVEQLAGDLLPKATNEQKIATGFNRNHRANSEGGIIPEEYAVEYVVDRVDTTATVWLGLTAGCARCHDHKFDPISQREFYSLYAFFNSVPEKGRALKLGNSPPFVKAMTADHSREIERLGKAAMERSAAIGSKLGDTPVQEVFRRWKADLPPTAEWVPSWKLLTHYPLDADAESLRPRGGKVAYREGAVDLGARFDNAIVLEDPKAGAFGFQDQFTLTCWVNPDEAGGPILTRMIDEQHGEGYGVFLRNGRIQVQMTKRWLDDALRVETKSPIEPGKWHHITVAYDGGRDAGAVMIFVNGVRQKMAVQLDELNQTFATEQPFRVGGGGGARFRGMIDEVRIYGERLDDGTIQAVSVREKIGELARLPVEEQKGARRKKLEIAFYEHGGPPEMRERWQAYLLASDEFYRTATSVPTVMVMEELPTPRPAHVLIRGQYDRPGERVERGVPKALSPFPEGRPLNRLGFAEWLVDPRNPLTARVAVNRMWQLHFGAGIVRTTEDFGVQGDPPSHRELLDWLAVRFVQSGWDVKALHRLIVTSSTYRQSSKPSPAGLAKDPENRLLGRWPRLRLSAEVVRDQALAASGLLAQRVGGPSVKPYQPAGLWNDLTGGKDYVADTGEGLYRRSLYTFWKRTIAPPNMLAFDAAGRETCSVRDSRTNTPLQALALLNDVAFVEASRVLAQNAMSEAKSPDARLTQMFRRVLARSPTDAEMALLRGAFDAQREAFRGEPAAARKWVAVGDTAAPAGLDPVELAAYGNVASLILNLDEAITRE